ncbi:2-formylbenzoate dehydrogenase [compost metagenome]
MVAGMNFTWCGQSCGSTSRAFLHASIHDEVIRLAKIKMAKFSPGDPTDPATTMGAMITAEHMQRSLDFIASAHEQGATLAYGGERPSDPALAGGNFLLPTMFTGVKQPMKLASEEAFGPVLAVLEWSDEAEMLADVNRVEYGLTCSIWTNDVRNAHRLAADVEAGYVWINEVSRHLLGTPFGGYKQSGMGREECLDELLAYTQEKHVHVNLKRPAR